jgi:hypothetical protein
MALENRQLTTCLQEHIDHIIVLKFPLHADKAYNNSNSNKQQSNPLFKAALSLPPPLTSPLYLYTDDRPSLLLFLALNLAARYQTKRHPRGEDICPGERCTPVAGVKAANANATSKAHPFRD